MQRQRIEKSHVHVLDGKFNHSREFTILSAIEDIIFVLDRQYRHKALYGKWLQKYSIDAGLFLNKSAEDLFGTEAARPHLEAARQAFSGKRVTYEWDLHYNEQFFYFQTSLFPLFRGSEITEIIGVGRDISSLKQIHMRQALIIRILDYIRISESIVDILYYVINEVKKLTGIRHVSIDFCSDSLRVPVEPSSEYQSMIRFCRKCRQESLHSNASVSCHRIMELKNDGLPMIITQYGSAWANNLTSTLNDCFHETTGSVAFIPVCQHDKRIAMLHFRDVNPEKFSEDLISGIEEMCFAITMAITKKVDEQLLHESEQTARTLLDLPFWEVFMIDKNGTILDLNQTACKRIGKRYDSLIGSSLFEHITTGSANIVEKCINEVIQTGRLVTHEQEMSGRFYYMRFSPIVNQLKTITKIAIYAHDLTDYRQLLYRRRWLSSIVESSPDAIISIMPDGTIMSWNRSAELLYGKSAESMIGSNIRDHYTPERSAFYKIIADRVKEGYIVENEEIVRTIQGKAYNLSLSVYPIWIENNQIQGMTIMLRDISYQKMAESILLRQSLAFENINESLLITDVTGIIIDCNRATEELFVFSREEMIGQDPYIIYKERDARQKLPAIIQHTTDTGQWAGELILTKKNGRTIVCDVKIVVIRDPNDIVKGAVTILRDISLHKQKEKQITDYQKKLRTMVAELSLAEDRERKKIAVSLHDSIAQLLVLSKMNLDSILDVTEDTAAYETLSATIEYVSEAIRTIRSMSFELCPAVFYEDGLESALAWLAEHIERRYGLSVTFSTTISLDFNDEATNILMFQAVRELLINAVKHAQAREVDIKAALSNEGTTITVKDDGTGFEPMRNEQPADSQRGFGLFSITERLRSIGGEVRINSQPGNGSSIILIVPNHERRMSNADQDNSC